MSWILTFVFENPCHPREHFWVVVFAILDQCHLTTVTLSRPLSFSPSTFSLPQKELSICHAGVLRELQIDLEWSQFSILLILLPKTPMENVLHAPFSALPKVSECWLFSTD